MVPKPEDWGNIWPNWGCSILCGSSINHILLRTNLNLRIHQNYKDGHFQLWLQELEEESLSKKYILKYILQHWPTIFTGAPNQIKISRITGKYLHKFGRRENREQEIFSQSHCKYIQRNNIGSPKHFHPKQKKCNPHKINHGGKRKNWLRQSKNFQQKVQDIKISNTTVGCEEQG